MERGLLRLDQASPDYLEKLIALGLYPPKRLKITHTNTCNENMIVLASNGYATPIPMPEYHEARRRCKAVCVALLALDPSFEKVALEIWTTRSDTSWNPSPWASMLKEMCYKTCFLLLFAFVLKYIKG